MAWNEFVKFTTIDADEINGNFDLFTSGDLMPRTGIEMTTTSSVFDIGSSINRFDTLYMDNVPNTDSDPSLGLESPIAQIVLSASASEIEFTGLNFDNDVFLRIDGTIKTDSVSALGILMQFNGDNGNNYGYVGFQYTSSVLGFRDSTYNGFLIGYINATSHESSFRTFFHLGKGMIRTSSIEVISSPSGSSIASIHIKSGLWSNFSDTVESVKIINTGSKNFVFGTVITIY